MVKTGQFKVKCKGGHRPSDGSKTANITLVGLHLDR